jgi:RNA polymerase sigma factor (TIGR02999 family)
MSDVTRILSQIDSGDPSAAEQLLPLVYDELRKLAATKLAHEKPGQTLQATALVHEAYLRLVRSESEEDRGREGEGETNAPLPLLASPPAFSSRGHFFGAAAEAMRRILIEQARRKRALKSGGAGQRRELQEVEEPAVEETAGTLDLLALDEALVKLQQQSPRKAALVKLRYFAGLTIDEAAQALGIAASTASSDWVYAKSWLRLEMRAGE